MIFVHSQRSGYEAIVKTFSTDEIADKWIKDREKSNKEYVITKLVSYSELEFYKSGYEKLFEKLMNNEMIVRNKSQVGF